MVEFIQTIVGILLIAAFSFVLGVVMAEEAQSGKGDKNAKD